MSHFVDLSAYSYRPSSLSTLNVGWLDATQSFEEAYPPPWLLSQLWQFCLISVYPTRGVHRCPFCPSLLDNYVERDGSRLLLGTAEILVFGEKGEPAFAAPDLIYHYVIKHNYSPPNQFLHAVQAGPQPAGAEYRELLRRAQVKWSPAAFQDDPLVEAPAAPSPSSDPVPR